jgi:hypothetical protein
MNVVRNAWKEKRTTNENVRNEENAAHHTQEIKFVVKIKVSYAIGLSHRSTRNVCQAQTTA